MILGGQVIMWLWCVSCFLFIRYIFIYIIWYIYIHTLYQDVPSPVLASFWPFKKPTFGTSLTFPVHTFSIQAALKPSAACAPRSFSTSAPTRTNVPWQKGSVQKYIFAKVMDHLFLTTFFQRNSGFSLLLCCLIVIPVVYERNPVPVQILLVYPCLSHLKGKVLETSQVLISKYLPCLSIFTVK